jgi:hypothetical protein
MNGVVFDWLAEVLDAEQATGARDREGVLDHEQQPEYR